VKISIVTPSFNGRAYLEQAARSVLSQQGAFDLEWIVVDGGSTDGTVEFLRSIRDDRVRWSSEADRGQSHAINKGLALAGGDVVAWLNTDDLYAPGALAAAADAFQRHPAAQWLAGRYEIIDADGAVIRPAVARYKERSLRRYSYRALLRENFVSQPAVFWRREFGRRVGPLDESLHYTMDYDLWLRMGREVAPLRVDRVLAQFRLHGGSKSGRAKVELPEYFVLPVDVVRAVWHDDAWGKMFLREIDNAVQYRVACRYVGDDRASRWVHRFNVEKIVWAYRVMRVVGM
jgi:glycosyltransferase involved in cell wall biosynthesis